MDTNSPVSRVVALLAPLFLAAATFVANEAQSLLGLHLDAGALAAYESAFVLAVGGIVWKWLDGRSRWEAAHVTPAPAPQRVLIDEKAEPTAADAGPPAKPRPLVPEWSGSDR